MGVLDRYGEPIEVVTPESSEQLHDRRCVDGWLGETDKGALIPCYVCRPHLKDRHHRRTTPRRLRR